MSNHIHSWIDGHLALRERAYQVRGAIQLDSGARWPRTTGADVIAIAALFDHAARVNGTPQPRAASESPGPTGPTNRD